MSNRERNMLIIAAILALVTLPWWPIWGNGGGVNELGLQESSLEAFESLKRAQADMPRLDLGTLEQEKEPFSGATRNLFEYGREESQADNFQEEVADIRDETIEEGDPLLIEEVSQTEQQPVRRQPRLAGYECIGIYKNQQQLHAVIQWRQQLFVATTDEIVNKAFRIETIDQQSVTIFVLDGEYTQKLRLKSPAGQQGAF